MQNQELEGDLAILSAASYNDVKRLAEMLDEGGIRTTIIKEGGGGCGSGCGCSGGSNFLLLCEAKNFDASQAVFTEERRRLAAGVDSPDALKFLDRVVDFDSGEAHCPACDTVVPPGTDNCPDCGLFVGVPKGAGGDCCGD